MGNICIHFVQYTLLLLLLLSRHTQRLRSGLKKMSLRRSPQHRKKVTPRSLPTDLDSGRLEEDGDHTGQMPDISPVSSKISLSSLSTPGSQPNALSLETMSLSSASEFSATGTDERSMSSPLGDRESNNSETIDILADRTHLSSDSPKTILSDSPSNLSLETSDGYFATSSVSIDVRRPKPLKVSTLPRMGKRQSSSSRGSEQQDSNSLLLPPTKPVRDFSKRSQASISVHSVVQPESDSDIENDDATPIDPAVPQSPQVVVSRSSTLGSENMQDESHSRSGTLRGSEGGSQETLVSTGMTASPAAAVDGGMNRTLTEREVASKAETTPVDSSSVASPNGCDEHPSVESAPKHQEDSDLLQVNRARSNSNSKRSLPIASGLLLRHSSTSPFKPVVRNRSMSNNPQVKKKPKPPPRLFIKKLNDNDSEKREALFVSSLPSDFKPVPFARTLKPKEPVSSEVMSSERTDENDDKLKKSENMPTTSEEARDQVSVADLSSSKDDSNISNNANVSSEESTNIEKVITPGTGTEDVSADDVESYTSDKAGLSPGNAKTILDNNSSLLAKENSIDGAAVSELPEGGTSSGPERQSKTSGQSSGESGCMSPTDFTGSDPSVAFPIRPPRRKRNTKIKKDAISLPLTPEHTRANNEANEAPSSSSCDTTSCDQSPVHTSANIIADFVVIESPSEFKDRSSDSTSSKSRDQDGSESNQSQHDIDCSNDKSQELSVNMLFNDYDEPLSPLVEGLRNAPMKSFEHKQLQNRISQNSMTAHTGSTPTPGSTLYRPYSMMLSGDESFMNGGEHSSELFSSGGRFTLPRQHSNLGAMALEFDHHQTLEYRHSAIMSPSSSEYPEHNYPLIYKGSIRFICQ